MTPLVRFENVSKSFDGGIAAIEDVSFEVLPRARIALMGRSGSGKTTIFNLAAGLDEPSAGTISWPGLNPPLLPEQISVAFQDSSLIPWLTVEENIALPLQLIGAAELSRPAELLAGFDIGELLQKLPTEISGGQAQRVGLARAMATSPRLLLADEPSGQLDHGTAELVVDRLFDWADRVGAALIVATHDTELAKRFQSVWTVEHGTLMGAAQ